MDILKTGNDAVQPILAIVDVLKQAKGLGSSEDVLKALRDYAANPAAGGPVAAIVGAVGVNAAAVQKFIKDNDAKLALVLGTVNDLAGQKLAWPLSKTAAANVGVVSIDVEATVEASIAADADKDLFDDGSVTYADTEAFLMVEVDGKVSSGANVPKLPIGSVSASAAFGASASVKFGNYFKHLKTDSALEALTSALTTLKLPYQADALTPSQYVLLSDTGSIAVSGSLEWGKSFVDTRTVDAASLGIDDAPINTSVKLSASLSFAAEMSGAFTIFVSAPGNGRLRVQLLKKSDRSTELALKASAGIDVTGIDKIAKAALDQITSAITPLIADLQANVAKYGDVKKLFDGLVNEEIDALLAKENVTSQITEWLKAIGANVDLKAKLKTALVNAVDKNAGPLVDDVNNAIQPVVELVKKLIANYQKSLAKLNAAIQQAAQIHIGIELAHTRKSTSAETVALTFDLDATRQDLYRPMVHGDFTEAMRLARAGDPAAKLVEGAWHKEGSLTVSSSLNISAFGHNVGLGSLLKEEWTFDISATGDLTIGLSDSVQAYSKGWRVLRSVSFVADTKVLAVVGAADKLVSAQETTTASVEIARDWTPSAAELETWRKTVVGLGVIDAATLFTGVPSPAGELSTSAVIKLTSDQWQIVAAQAVDVASLKFVQQLQAFYLSAFPYDEADGNGFPFLTWKSVRDWSAGLPSGTVQFFDSHDFERTGGNKVQVGAAQLLLVHNTVQLVTAYEAIQTQLLALHSAKPLTGLSADEALTRVRAEQHTLLQAVAKVLKFSTDREAVGKAFFKTIWDLAGGTLAVDGIVVILEKSVTPNVRLIYA